MFSGIYTQFLKSKNERNGKGNSSFFIKQEISSHRSHEIAMRFQMLKDNADMSMQHEIA